VVGQGVTRSRSSQADRNYSATLVLYHLQLSRESFCIQDQYQRCSPHVSNRLRFTRARVDAVTPDSDNGRQQPPKHVQTRDTARIRDQRKREEEAHACGQDGIALLSVPPMVIARTKRCTSSSEERKRTKNCSKRTHTVKAMDRSTIGSSLSG
jgi:hypothetical protein